MMHTSYSTASAKPRFAAWQVALSTLLALALCAGAAAAQPTQRKASADAAASRLTEHEARRAKFKNLCANPTPSQRETLEILAEGEGKKWGTEFCADVEFDYFGTQSKPRTREFMAFKTEKEIRDISVFQYFYGLTSFSVDKNVSDLSSIADYTSLERLHIIDNKNILDISVVANFKNLKSLTLRNTQVKSLAPLAGLSQLEDLDLSVDTHTGLPGRKDFDAIRSLKNLKKLTIVTAEPIGDQFKDLRQLTNLIIYGPVKDVCSFKDLTKLTSLFLIRSGVQDVSCLKNQKALVALALQGNPIKSLAGLMPLPNLRNLSIEDTLIEDLSPLTNNPNMFIVDAKNTPLRWCSPKTAEDIVKGISCLNPDGSEKPWWKRLLRL